MACDGVIDYIVRETGRYLEDEIFRLSFPQSPWMALTPRGEHPTGMGEVINVLTWERTAPLGSDLTWLPMTIQSGQEGGICNPPATEIRTGSTTRNFQLERALFKGPKFCAEEGRSAFSLATQLNAISSQMGDFSRLAWEQRDRNEYMRLTQNKIIVDGCPPTIDRDGLETWDAVATAQGATCPTSQLTQGILDRERVYLVRNGATPIANLSTGQPILALVADAETLKGLITNNDDIRQDIRYATMGQGMGRADLLQAMGVERTYAGYLHIEDLFPNRYDCDAGTYTKIPTWIEVSSAGGLKGNKATLNPAWVVGTYTESHIHSRSVYRQNIPRPIISPGGGQTFDSVNYVGNVMWKNILSEDCNPLGLLITPYLLLAASSMPMRPDHGTSLIHLMCPPPCALITSCAT